MTRFSRFTLHKPRMRKAIHGSMTLSRRGLSAGRFPSPVPPDRQPAPQPAGERQIVREHQEAKRQHPEAEDGQEAQQSAENESHADCHPRDARARHADAEGAEHELVVCMIDAETLCPHLALRACPRLSAIVPISHPQEMGAGSPNTSSFHFFEKTAWQIGKAFVLAHSHRAKQ